MSNVRGVFGTRNLESGISKLDVRDMIFELQPEEAPFVTMLKGASKIKAQDMTINWFEDDILAMYTRINYGSGYNTSATDLVVDDSSIFAVGDVIKNTRSGEVMRVTVVDDATNTITVVRGWGATAADSIVNDDYLYRLGQAMQEGWTSPEALVTAKAKVSNYLQIFSKTVQITETATGIATYGGNRRDFERNKKGREIKMDIEAQLLFGEPKEDTTGTHLRWQTGGVYHFIKTNGASLNAAGALTESAWEGFLRDLFAYGANKKTFFAGPLILSQISAFAASKQRVTPGKGKYGFSVSTYHSAVGDVDLVLTKRFTGPWAGWGFGLEMEDVIYRYLEGQDITLKTNVQNKKDHHFIDEYYGTLGLEIHHAKKHGFIYGVTA